MHVGREYLYLRLAVGFFQPLMQQHGDRVSLFARCAAGDPNANFSARLGAINQLRHDIAFQFVERLGITKETRDANEQVLIERIQFGRIALEMGRVLIDIVELPHFQVAAGSGDRRWFPCSGKNRCRIRYSAGERWSRCFCQLAHRSSRLPGPWAANEDASTVRRASPRASSTRSTTPVSRATSGMPSNFAVSSLSHKTSPPA